MRWCCWIWKEQQYWEGVPDWLLKIAEEEPDA
jgi:exopolyphosphatase/guanosine-5'-triphosphate,3'-diphosphate pyrophosphatase